MMQNGANTLRSLTLFVSSHFMFNVLGKLQSEILSGEKRQAISTLTLYSKLLRQACDLSSKEKVSLVEEKRFLDNYLKLEQERFVETPFYYSFENFDHELDFIVPFILQPFVELAVLSSLGSTNLLKISYNSVNHSFRIQSEMKNPDAANKLSEKCEIAQERILHFKFVYEATLNDSMFIQDIRLPEL